MHVNTPLFEVDIEGPELLLIAMTFLLLALVRTK